MKIRINISEQDKDKPLPAPVLSLVQGAKILLALSPEIDVKVRFNGERLV